MLKVLDLLTGMSAWVSRIASAALGGVAIKVAEDNPSSVADILSALGSMRELLAPAGQAAGAALARTDEVQAQVRVAPPPLRAPSAHA